MRATYFLGLMLAVLAVAGCVSTGSFLGGRLVKNLAPLEGDPASLRNISYTATDTLADQMQRGGVNAVTPITVAGLKAISLTTTPASSITAYGPVVQQHVTNRLLQHGFRVGGGVIPPKSRSKDKSAGPVTLSGDYILAGSEVLMHLEMVEDKSGKIIAAHDFTVPVSPEVEAVLVGRAAPAIPALAVAQKWPEMQAAPVYTAPYVADTETGIPVPPRKPTL